MSDFQVERVIFQEKMRDFRVKWGISEEKMCDSWDNGVFLERKCMILGKMRIFQEKTHDICLNVGFSEIKQLIFG